MLIQCLELLVRDFARLLARWYKLSKAFLLCGTVVQVLERDQQCSQLDYNQPGGPCFKYPWTNETEKETLVCKTADAFNECVAIATKGIYMHGGQAMGYCQLQYIHLLGKAVAAGMRRLARGSHSPTNVVLCWATYDNTFLN